MEEEIIQTQKRTFQSQLEHITPLFMHKAAESQLLKLKAKIIFFKADADQVKRMIDEELQRRRKPTHKQRYQIAQHRQQHRYRYFAAIIIVLVIAASGFAGLLDVFRPPVKKDGTSMSLPPVSGWIGSFAVATIILTLGYFFFFVRAKKNLD